MTDVSHSREEIERILREAQVVAVLGFHADSTRPAHYVPEYLSRRRYTVIPVNPKLAGQTFFGHKAVASLTDIEVEVDVVEVFRRSDAVPAHVDEILAMQPLPKVVWMQQGVRSEEAAARLSGAGITVVQDRCMLADHRALL